MVCWFVVEFLAKFILRENLDNQSFKFLLIIDDQRLNSSSLVQGPSVLLICSRLLMTPTMLSIRSIVRTVRRDPRVQARGSRLGAVIKIKGKWLFIEKDGLD